MHQEEIKVSWGGDPKPTIPIKAVLVGDYMAVHKLVVDSSGTQIADLWKVTHVPSGMSVSPGFETRRNALQFAKRLQTYGKRVGLNLRARTLRGIRNGNGKGFAAWKEYRAKLISELV
jgi:hypothetical protein